MRQLNSLTSDFGRGTYSFSKECGDAVEFKLGCAVERNEDKIYISKSEYQRLGRPKIIEVSMVVKVVRR